MQTTTIPEQQTVADISKSRYFLYVAILFVAVLLISNTVAVKLIQIGPFILAGAVFIFPISYIFGDVLTEVYGYKSTQKVIYAGFAMLILMTACYTMVQLLPAAPFWASNQAAYDTILGNIPRLVLASIVAFFFGEFCNSYVISRLKVITGGKRLWQRTISSTVVGQFVDSAIFTTIAFAGTIPTGALVVVAFSGYLFKVCYEILATPLTYIIVNKIKRAEGIDVYDHGVDYNMFKL
jgi:queuosine precursor transporter